jgi:hypothetical protein
MRAAERRAAKAITMATPTAVTGQACDGRPDWHNQAVCRDADPDLFFPDGDVRSARAQVKMAKLILLWLPGPHRQHELGTGQPPGARHLGRPDRRRTAQTAPPHPPWAAERWPVLGARGI